MPSDLNLGLQSQGAIKLKSTNNDAAVLRSLVAQLNTPATPEDAERKQVSPEAQREIEQAFKDAKTALPIAAPPLLADTEQPSTADAIAMTTEALDLAAPRIKSDNSPAKIFITGREGSLQRLLAGLPASAQLVSLNKSVSETLKAIGQLKGEPPASLVSAFRQWGDGSTQPTVERLILLGFIRGSYLEDFCTAGFWAKLALEAINKSTAQQKIVIGINTGLEQKTLTDAGFIHYHAWSNTVPSPGDSTSALLTALDNDVSRQISAQRTGPPRLRVIWMDDATKCPAIDRMFTPEQFRNEVVSVAPEVVESALVI